MPLTLSLAFECAPLRRLTGADCSTPKCLTNAYATGRIFTDGHSHYVELMCPDCDDAMLIGSPDVDDLATALANASPDEHELIATRWVKPRIGDVHPCRTRPGR